MYTYPTLKNICWEDLIVHHTVRLVHTTNTYIGERERKREREREREKEEREGWERGSGSEREGGGERRVRRTGERCDESLNHEETTSNYSNRTFSPCMTSQSMHSHQLAGHAPSTIDEQRNKNQISHIHSLTTLTYMHTRMHACTHVIM